MSQGRGLYQAPAPSIERIPMSAPSLETLISIAAGQIRQLIAAQAPQSCQQEVYALRGDLLAADKRLAEATGQLNALESAFVEVEKAYLRSPADMSAAAELVSVFDQKVKAMAAVAIASDRRAKCLDRIDLLPRQVAILLEALEVLTNIPSVSVYGSCWPPANKTLQLVLEACRATELENLQLSLQAFVDLNTTLSDLLESTKVRDWDSRRQP